MYLLKRLTCDELDIINEYAMYNYEFPSTTIIEKFELFNDYDSNFLNHSQAVMATLLVPNNEMDKLFPQEIRDYDGIYTSDLSNGKTNEKSVVRSMAAKNSSEMVCIESTARHNVYCNGTRKRQDTSLPFG